MYPSRTTICRRWDGRLYLFDIFYRQHDGNVLRLFRDRYRDFIVYWDIHHIHHNDTPRFRSAASYEAAAR